MKLGTHIWYQEQVWRLASEKHWIKGRVLIKNFNHT